MVLFEEKQTFNQWWLKVIFAAVGFETLAVMLYNYQSTGDVSTGSYFSLLVLTLVILLFWIMNLTTRIDETGISYRFFPFHLKPKHLRWDELESAFVREYKPLAEYGGWGIRFSGNGTAYNVKGKTGLQLVLKNGKKILIGTSDKQRLTFAIEQLQQNKIIPVVSL